MYTKEEAIQFRTNREYALSFQSKDGALTIWNLIQNILQNHSDSESIILPNPQETNLEETQDSMNKLICSGQ